MRINNVPTVIHFILSKKYFLLHILFTITLSFLNNIETNHICHFHIVLFFKVGRLKMHAPVLSVWVQYLVSASSPVSQYWSLHLICQHLESTSKWERETSATGIEYSRSQKQKSEKGTKKHQSQRKTSEQESEYNQKQIQVKVWFGVKHIHKLWIELKVDSVIFCLLVWKLHWTLYLQGMYSQQMHARHITGEEIIA